MLLCLEGRKGPLTCGFAIWGPENSVLGIVVSDSVIIVSNASTVGRHGDSAFSQVRGLLGGFGGMLLKHEMFIIG
jgi:hypothetical protein